MHFALIIRDLGIGGAQRQLVALANGLAGRGHRVSVLVFYAGGEFLDDLAPAVDRIDLGKRSRFDLTGFLRRFRRALARLAPDVIYAWLPTANLIAALDRAAGRRVPLVWGLRAIDIDPRGYDRLHRLILWLERRLSGVPDLLIANGRSVRDAAVARGFPADRVQVIENGVDSERFLPAPARGLALRRELGLRADAPVVGMIARLDPMKDHEGFLEAAALAARARPQARFVLVGDGPTERLDRLQARAADLGIADRVLWLGRRPDVADLYNAFDLCTLTSRFGEGFPNVVAEAMACGRPCVVTDVGEARRIVDDPQRVVPTGDPVALAAAWTRSLDLAAESGAHDQAGGLRERICENFSLKAMIARSEAALVARADARPRAL